MQWEYVYADMQLTVTFKAEGHSPFMVLTDAEVKALQQLVYHGLMIFNNMRMLYIADAAMDKKYTDCAVHSCQCTCHRG